MMMVGLAVVTLEMAAFSPGLRPKPDIDEDECPPLEFACREDEEDSSIISCRMCRVEGDSRLGGEGAAED